MKSGNLNSLEPSGPLQACNGTDLSCQTDSDQMNITAEFPTWGRGGVGGAARILLRHLSLWDQESLIPILFCSRSSAERNDPFPQLMVPIMWSVNSSNVYANVTWHLDTAVTWTLTFPLSQSSCKTYFINIEHAVYTVHLTYVAFHQYEHLYILLKNVSSILEQPVYKGADTSLARPGRKQATCMSKSSCMMDPTRSREMPRCSAIDLAKIRRSSKFSTWTWSIIFGVVGLRTYQHPGIWLTHVD